MDGREGRRKKEEGRRKRGVRFVGRFSFFREGRRKRGVRFVREGRRKKEEGRRKRGVRFAGRFSFFREGRRKRGVRFVFGICFFFVGFWPVDDAVAFGGKTWLKFGVF